MTDVWTMGELLAEIMRPERDLPLGRPGPFVGPYASGAPGIFIDAVARLGRSGAIVSAVGDDEFGRMLLERLERDGVRIDHVRVMPGRTTGTAFIAYRQDGSRSYVFHWAGTPAVMAEVPPPEVMTGARLFHVMGCSLMPDAAFAERILATADRFARAGARITFDPNIRTELMTPRTLDEVIRPMLDRASILLPGAAELHALAGSDGLDTAANALMRRHGLEVVVVKLGPPGCVVYTEDRRVEVPGFAVDEVDPTGAGDCFDAAYLCALLDGADHEEAAQQGAAAGALAAAAFGPMEGDISPASIRALRERQEPGRDPSRD